MEYIKHTHDVYIQSVQSNAPKGTGNCTAEEYQSIMTAIKTAPVPPNGYGVHLRTDLTWETYALPDDPVDEEATAEDYLAALAEMGVMLDGD